MRQPTNQSEAYSHWRRRLKGELLNIYINDPECGYYKTRAWARGPYIPAKIWLEQEIDEHGELATDEILKAEVGEQEWDAHEAWLRIAAKPISLTEWEMLLKALPIVKQDKAEAQTYCLV